MKTTLATAAAVATGLLALPGGASASCPADDPCPPAPTRVAHVGTFNGGSSAYVAVFRGPGRSYGVLRTVRTRTRALIVCQTSGARVSGPYGTSRVWDKLKHGGYVSDTNVYTGSDGRVAPAC